MLMVIPNQDRTVADWAELAMGAPFHAPYSALGIVEPDGLLKGAAIFNDFYPGGNIELTFVGPGTITRSVIRELCSYAFDKCGASRVTCKTNTRNVVVRKLLPRLGFKMEMRLKRYYDDAQDAYCFVFYREDAKRWIGH
jgi:RimJ/RimL family protein N-acetyltransferase